MSETSADGPRPVGQLPQSLWALGWTSVAGQVLGLVERGPQEASSWAGSIVLGVLLVTLVVHGVVRARAFRFWLVALLLGLGTVFGMISLVLDPSPWDAAYVALGVLQLFLLRVYRASHWFAWQRTRPSTGPSIVPILLVAVLVGALGGLLGSPSNGPRFDMHVNV